VSLIQKILSGYKKLFGQLLKILCILVFCIGIGFLTVYPLWYFASAKPGLYTISVFCAFFAGFAVFVTAKVRAGIRNCSPGEWRKKAVSFALTAAKAAAVIVGICASCAAVLHGQRLLALAVVIAAVIIYGICAFGAKSN
jgi:FtsH-binding integral membrane protein